MERDLPPHSPLPNDPNTELEPTPPEEQDQFEPVIDQTRFSEDLVIEDFYEDEESLLAEHTVWWKNKKILLALGAGVFMVILMVTALLLQRNSSMGLPLQMPGEETPEDTENIDELTRKLLLLDQDIEAADPLEAELAFPPVDYELTLEDASTRERLEEQRRAQ